MSWRLTLAVDHPVGAPLSHTCRVFGDPLPEPPGDGERGWPTGAGKPRTSTTGNRWRACVGPVVYPRKEGRIAASSGTSPGRTG